MRSSAVLACLLLAPLPAFAQSSTSYHLTDHALNAGGQPANGAVSASPSFRLELDALGDAVAWTGLSSASFHADAGFVSDYPPPGETLGLRFSSKTALSWSPEKSVGHYELYAEPLSDLSSGGTGACLQSGLTTESATDATTPGPGSGLFYLVTARNRLSDEGTKGFRTGGAERSNPAPCP